MSRRILAKRTVVVLVIAFVIAGVISGYFIGYDRIARRVRGSYAALTRDWSGGEAEYPEIDTNQLSDFQERIVTLTRQEFSTQPPGEKYSDGQREAWCANFVSWVMKEADEPLTNPHSGGWRIPGTYTLYDYYVAEGRFRPTSSGYEPKLGDVAIYRDSPVFGDHANIVLSSDDGVLTTIGGNEGDRIRIYKNTQRNYDGLLGYGVLGIE